LNIFCRTEKCYLSSSDCLPVMFFLTLLIKKSILGCDKWFSAFSHIEWINLISSWISDSENSEVKQLKHVLRRYHSALSSSKIYNLAMKLFLIFSLKIKPVKIFLKKFHLTKFARKMNRLFEFAMKYHFNLVDS
jgi:hypothetical protein